MKKITRKIVALICSVGFLSCCVPFSSQAMIGDDPMLDSRLKGALSQELSVEQKIDGAMCFIHCFGGEYSAYLMPTAACSLLPFNIALMYNHFSSYGHCYYGEKSLLGELDDFFTKVLKREDESLRAKFKENTPERVFMTCFLDELKRNAKDHGLKDFDAICRWGHVSRVAGREVGWQESVAACFNSFVDKLEHLYQSIQKDRGKYNPDDSFWMAELDNLFTDLECDFAEKGLYGRILSTFAHSEKRTTDPTAAIVELSSPGECPTGTEGFKGYDIICACAFLTQYESALLAFAETIWAKV